MWASLKKHGGRDHFCHPAAVLPFDRFTAIASALCLLVIYSVPHHQTHLPHEGTVCPSCPWNSLEGISSGCGCQWEAPGKVLVSRPGIPFGMGTGSCGSLLSMAATWHALRWVQDGALRGRKGTSRLPQANFLSAFWWPHFEWHVLCTKISHWTLGLVHSPSLVFLLVHAEQSVNIYAYLAHKYLGDGEIFRGHCSRLALSAMRPLGKCAPSDVTAWGVSGYIPSIWTAFPSGVWAAAEAVWWADWWESLGEDPAAAHAVPAGAAPPASPAADSSKPPCPLPTGSECALNITGLPVNFGGDHAGQNGVEFCLRFILG